MSQKRHLKYGLKNFIKNIFFQIEMNTDLVWFVQNNHDYFKEVILTNDNVSEFVFNKGGRNIFFKSVFNKENNKYDVYICGFFRPFSLVPSFVFTYSEVIKSYSPKEFREKFVLMK